MSTTPKKPLSSSTMSAGANGRRQPINLPRSASPVARSQSPSTTQSTNGIVRTPSMKSPSGVARPSRASVRRPAQTSSSLSSSNTLNLENEYAEDDARAQNAVLMDNLKKSLRNAEMVSEDYHRQLGMMQKRLDDAIREQTKLEEQVHEGGEKIRELESQKVELSRQTRDASALHESERAALLKERDGQAIRETELKATIQRLKETLAGREMRVNADADRRMSRSGRTHSRSSSVDANGHFAPPSTIQPRDTSLQRSESRSVSRLVMQKDIAIESLRLELAEAQIKLAEIDNMKSDQMHELEKSLLESRMSNMRLMEDNESFQLLLGEKTLNGDFTKAEFMQGRPTEGTQRLGSLAEELESVQGESENYRRLEAESKSLRDQNKALTLYIEKIISRVLQHDNFETILDQMTDGTPKGASGSTHKDLPPPPPKDDEASTTVLQRAMSVVAGPRRQRPASQLIASTSTIPSDESTRRSRPQSQIIATAPAHQLSTNEDPFTAPRIPLGRTPSISGRGHRRTHSEKSDIATNAAAVVNQMYRGQLTGTGSAVQSISPGNTTPRTSYFASSGIVGTPANHRNDSHHRGTSGTRATSRSRVPLAGHGSVERVGSSSNSTVSRDSGDVSSPPRNNAGSTTYTGAVMAQSKLRPLRLVQENKAEHSQLRRANTTADDEDVAGRKKANRGSWMGWFNRGKDEGAPRSVSTGNVHG